MEKTPRSILAKGERYLRSVLAHHGLPHQPHRRSAALESVSDLRKLEGFTSGDLLDG